MQTNVNKKNKILIIGPVPPPYHGVAVSTQQILLSPNFDCFQIIHLDTSDRRSIENIGKFEMGNISLAIWHFLKFLDMLIRFHPQLVYLPISQGTGGYLRDLTFLMPSRWLGLKTVVHLRGSEFRTFYLNSSPIMQFLIRYSLANVKKVIVLSESLQSIFNGLVPAERISVVHNGNLDFSKSTRYSKKSNSSIHGLYLSNLRPRKGFIITLEAAIESVRKFQNLEFYFAGDWPSDEVRDQALRRIQESQTTERIHFLGVMIGEEKQQLLIESDFFIFPPIKPEGHPRVILEAMVASLPVITTNLGNAVGSVEDGQTGFIVQPNSVKEIIEKISIFIEDPDKMRKMGKASRQRYLDYFTIEGSNKKLAEAFSAVLSNK